MQVHGELIPDYEEVKKKVMETGKIPEDLKVKLTTIESKQQ